MKKEQVQEAIGRIDGILSKGRFTEPLLNREDHVVLSRDIQLIQQCCEGYFVDELVIKDLENERANIIPIHPESDDENSEGSGDSV